MNLLLDLALILMKHFYISEKAMKIFGFDRVPKKLKVLAILLQKSIPLKENCALGPFEDV